MEIGSKSIADHIEGLARLTGAPRTFVLQVRELFERKGISLDSDAAPYARALDEAFTREQSIRSGALRARAHVARTRADFDRMGRRWVARVAGLRHPDAEDDESDADADDEPTRTIELALPDPRTLVVRTEHEALWLVPGPELPQ